MTRYSPPSCSCCGRTDCRRYQLALRGEIDYAATAECRAYAARVRAGP